jgi:hypothetical protein
MPDLPKLLELGKHKLDDWASILKICSWPSNSTVKNGEFDNNPVKLQPSLQRSRAPASLVFMRTS